MWRRCVCAALCVALRAWVAQRLAPSCSSVGLCVLVGGQIHTFPDVPAPVHVYTHVEACAHLSLGGMPLLTHLGACGYLCPPVSKPCVFLCMLVCTWISIGVSTHRVKIYGGAHWRNQDSPPNLPHCPASCGRVDGGGKGWKSPQPSSNEGVCVSVLGWGGAVREVRLVARGAQQGCTASAPPPGQSFLGMTLNHSVFACPVPAHSQEKRKNQGRLGGTKLPMCCVGCWGLS